MGRGAATVQAVIDEEASGVRLDRALARAIPDLSRERLKALILAGAVSAAGRAVTDPSAKVVGGAVYDVAVPNAVPAESPAQPIPLVVVHEDAELIVAWSGIGLFRAVGGGAIHGAFEPVRLIAG